MANRDTFFQGQVDSRRLALIVPGASWETPAVERSLLSLRREGLEAVSFRPSFGTESASLGYADVVKRLLSESRAERTVLVPAGVVARPGFADALRRWSESPAEADDASGSARNQRVLMAFQGQQPSEHARTLQVSEEMQRLVDDLGLGGKPGSNLQMYTSGRALRRPEGEDMFQRLQALGNAVRFESEPIVLDERQLDREYEGWVYRCNNEPLDVDLTAARGCDALVAVAAGIKPWYMANALRETLRQVVIFDSHKPQLGFAYRTWKGLGSARNWGELCDGSGYRSVEDRHLRSAHEELFPAIKRTRQEWEFPVTFVVANILTQTLGLIEYLKSAGVKRPVFWYSNIFQPYIGEGLSEHHAGLEYSFGLLVRDAFPEAVLYGAGTKPVVDPRVETFVPGFLFRVRRYISTRLV